MVNENHDILALIDGMRNEFLSFLFEKCVQVENYVIELHRNSQVETFYELFRVLHSTKGSAGTYGFFRLVTICHQFEDLLIVAKRASNYDDAFVNKSLYLVDLVRELVEIKLREKSHDPTDYTEFDKKLADISELQKPHSKKILISDTSKTMTKFYVGVLGGIDSVSVMLTDNGLDALKRLLTTEYDLFICAHEQKALGGIALSRALRASNSKNREVPIIMISNTDVQLSFVHEGISIIERDENLANNLSTQVKNTLGFSEIHTEGELIQEGY